MHVLCMYLSFGHHPRATSVPNLVSVVPSIAELAHGEKIAYSLSHSPGLVDALETEAFALEYTYP